MIIKQPLGIYLPADKKWLPRYLKNVQNDF